MTVVGWLLYLQYVLSQEIWALKTKYLLFLVPAYVLDVVIGLRWTRATLPTCARMDSRGRLSLRVLYESFAALKNFFDQLGCGRFHITSQHTFGTGGPK